MRFDPRLIQPDDAPLRNDGELDLPDDLAALAGQLADDAAHLSACYPADRNPQVALAAELADSAERLKRRAWRPSALAVGAGLASLAALVLTVSLSLRDSDPVDAQSVASPDSLATTVSPVAAETMSTSLPALAPTTLSLGELSGPEMEALFDLLQRDPQRTSSIAF
ncbi:MAG: hypothetical protein L0211_15250 [Planctomycetaceae bacterium]|nr:hypothetical protein [Planctomycetaceae bacterium]